MFLDILGTSDARINDALINVQVPRLAQLHTIRQDIREGPSVETYQPRLARVADLARLAELASLTELAGLTDGKIDRGVRKACGHNLLAPLRRMRPNPLALPTWELRSGIRRLGRVITPDKYRDELRTKHT